jgi:hypothetical protein
MTQHGQSKALLLNVSKADSRISYPLVTDCNALLLKACAASLLARCSQHVLTLRQNPPPPK